MNVSNNKWQFSAGARLLFSSHYAVDPKRFYRVYGYALKFLSQQNLWDVTAWPHLRSNQDWCIEQCQRIMKGT